MRDLYRPDVLPVTKPRASLPANECSLSMATATFNECIRPCGNRTWYEPTVRPSQRDEDIVNGTYGCLLSFSLAPTTLWFQTSLSLSQPAVSNQRSPARRTGLSEERASWERCLLRDYICLSVALAKNFQPLLLVRPRPCPACTGRVEVLWRDHLVAVVCQRTTPTTTITVSETWISHSPSV